MSAEESLQEKAISAISTDPAFGESLQAIARTSIDAALREASYRYWQDHPEVDVLGSNFDPIGAKNDAALLRQDAEDLIEALTEKGVGIAYSVLQQELGE